MSRNRGRRYELLLAEYLKKWWPGAECPPPSRPGSDVLGTPGIVWENKTAKAFEPMAFVRQAQRHAGLGVKLDRPTLAAGKDTMQVVDNVPVVVYWPQGVGEQNAGNTLAIVPLKVMVRLLKEAGY